MIDKLITLEDGTSITILEKVKNNQKTASWYFDFKDYLTLYARFCHKTCFKASLLLHYKCFRL